jgi:hypothetical protein
MKVYNIGENKVSLSQTSKGNWYCNELSIYCKDIFDGISLLDGAIEGIECILKEHNKVDIGN